MIYKVAMGAIALAITGTIATGGWVVNQVTHNSEKIAEQTAKQAHDSSEFREAIRNLNVRLDEIRADAKDNHRETMEAIGKIQQRR